ncbi:hypothetical protein SAMN04487970_100314 [Paenibacillus tianmuensis]|uniref:Uncharacterized protein n=1 Tax=Paenibacillus tianmuensis TaxID=624147 RepID=A0A1G4PKR5_9BACL|nr:hypothetical protein SAMN04487970_100314 [Paenibacillus tianmuensis]
MRRLIMCIATFSIIMTCSLTIANHDFILAHPESNKPVARSYVDDPGY